MQHIQIKLFAETSAAVRLHDAILVFHRWIQSNTLPGLFIDVADYAHVPAGPGVVLIGHEANVSLDESQHRLGLLYNRKAALEGADAENLEAVYQAALDAATRLESEPEFKGKLRFRRNEIQVILNDRLLYPNTEATWATLAPDVNAFLTKALGEGYTLERAQDPRERFSLTAVK